MRRLLALVVTAVVAGALLGAVLVARPAPAGALPAGHAAPAAVAQSGDPGDPATDPDGDSSTDDEPLPGDDIIPQPNSGREPTEAGDRGGALQGLVFVLILVGVGTILGLAVRESRKVRRRAAEAAAPRPTEPSPIAGVLAGSDDEPDDQPSGA